MTRRICATAVAVLAVSLLAFSAQSSAQSLSNLTSLLGGSKHKKKNSSQSNSGVTVQRNANPYVGQFIGKRTPKSTSGQNSQTGSGDNSQTGQSSQSDQSSKPKPPTSLTTQFACYPATDSAMPQTKAFMCYSVE